MALTLLYAERTKIDTLVLDAALRSGHQSDLDVTNHPVEEGLPTTDAARDLPNEATIVGIVSDTPIRQQDREAAAQQGAEARSLTALQVLLDLQKQKKLVTVVTKTRTYENVILQNLTWDDAPENGDALHFTAKLKQVRVVKLATVALPANDRAANKVNKGKQVAKETQPKNESLLHKAFGRFLK